MAKARKIIAGMTTLVASLALSSTLAFAATPALPAEILTGTDNAVQTSASAETDEMLSPFMEALGSVIEQNANDMHAEIEAGKVATNVEKIEKKIIDKSELKDSVQVAYVTITI